MSNTCIILHYMLLAECYEDISIELDSDAFYGGGGGGGGFI